MKKIIATLLFIALFGTSLLHAQNTHFTTSGTVEYEKSVNMYAIIKKEINKDNESYMTPILEQYKQKQPQFKKLKSVLTFGDDKTLYTPIVAENAGSFFGNEAMAGQNNTIFTDLAAGFTTAQKKVFEETFLVKDSTRKINWKITDETRVIAGYTCRRANALVLDTVYVVAFYTDQIPVSGGPESFSGLPGMILGVALPHENVTWFATKVTDNAIDPKTLVAPKKGKPTNNKELHKTLTEAMKDWGDYSQIMLKAFSL